MRPLRQKYLALRGCCQALPAASPNLAKRFRRRGIHLRRSRRSSWLSRRRTLTRFEPQGLDPTEGPNALAHPGDRGAAREAGREGRQCVDGDRSGAGRPIIDEVQKDPGEPSSASSEARRARARMHFVAALAREARSSPARAWTTNIERWRRWSATSCILRSIKLRVISAASTRLSPRLRQAWTRVVSCRSHSGD